MLTPSNVKMLYVHVARSTTHVLQSADCTNIGLAHTGIHHTAFCLTLAPNSSAYHSLTHSPHRGPTAVCRRSKQGSPSTLHLSKTVCPLIRVSRLFENSFVSPLHSFCMCPSTPTEILDFTQLTLCSSQQNCKFIKSKVPTAHISGLVIYSSNLLPSTCNKLIPCYSALRTES